MGLAEGFSDPMSDLDSRQDRSLALQLEQARAELRHLHALLDQRQEEPAPELASQHSYLLSLLENLQDVILLLDAQGVLVGLAGNLMGMLGTTEEAVLAQPAAARLDALVHPQDRHDLEQQAGRLAHAYGTAQRRLRLLDAAGEVRWGDALLVPLRDEAGEYIGAQVIISDVSDRVQAEAMVHSLVAAAQAVQHASLSTDLVLGAVTDELAARGFMAAIGIMTADQSGLRLARMAGDRAALDSVERLLGTAGNADYVVPLAGAPDALRACVADLVSRYCLPDEESLSRLLPGRDRRLASAILRLLPRLHTILAPLVADGELMGVLAVAGHGVNRALIPPVAAYANHAAIALRNAQLVSQVMASEEQYRGVFEAVQDGLLVVSPEGLVVGANPTLLELVGRSQAQTNGLSLAQLFGGPDRDKVAEFLGAMAAEGHYAAQWQPTLPGSADRQLLVHGTAMTYRGAPHWLMALHDVTEQVRAQEALVSAERLQALGQMAGGIAHDFNNILVSVRGYADAALLDLRSGADTVREDLQRIVAGADDAAEAVRRLQSLYRPADDTSDFAPVDLDELVRDAMSLTRPHWRDAAQARGVMVRVTAELGAPPPIAGNASELRRVLTNLVVNAIEAMPTGGEIALATSHQATGCCVVVADTGVGMSAKERERVFEPFFSTKGSSGLGLAVSRAIIQRHGGSIRVSSTPGVGTTFVITLPASVPEAGMLALSEPALAVATPPLSVLVVDDESSVRGLMRRFLERHGHAVELATGAQEALALLARQRFDLLITDLGMPDMAGDELARQAHTLDSGLRIILSTGWGATISPGQLAAMHAHGLLPKPFTHEELGRVLRDVAVGRGRP